MIKHLAVNYSIYDFQLQDHFLNATNLNVLQCGCNNHKHNKEPCRIVYEPECSKCKTPTRLLTTYQSLLFHPELAVRALTKCCTHIHEPPCLRCINCKTAQPCIVTAPFECTTSTDVVCHLNPNQFTIEESAPDIKIEEHIYNTKVPTFYLCSVHMHYHTIYPTIPCIMQTFKCCDNAVFIKDYTQCFAVTIKNRGVPPTTSTRANSKNAGGSGKTGQSKAQQKNRDQSFIIFDPSIWREQSYNHFLSFIRAIIIDPKINSNTIMDRYRRYESSNFAISNIKKYISGKESIIRTAITGFDASGIYQTSIISCTIPYHTVVLPQKLYKLLEADGYDTDLVMVNRDPSLLSTCMYVCSVFVNPDPDIDVVIISDQQSKGVSLVFCCNKYCDF